MPDLEKYKAYIEKIYASGWFTNNGPLVQELQGRLSDFLGVKRLLLLANGTLALQAAYKLLELKGDVLTTPFSFVATTSSLVWEGLRPIFVDIDKETFNLDPAKLEAGITEATSAIVATHVYGNACDVDAIGQFAARHRLKVVYDAAHAFHVRLKNRSLLECGDISAISFHSTKIFHTIEGGALVFADDALYERARKLINFGIEGPSIITGLGVNMKMNEFQAAMGLCMLDEFERNLYGRRRASDIYRDGLRDVPYVSFQRRHSDCTENYSHFPVLFDREETLLTVMRKLEQADIYPRRYFYPSLETMSYVEPGQHVPVSADIAGRILCLPLFAEIAPDVQEHVIRVIRSAQG